MSAGATPGPSFGRGYVAYVRAHKACREQDGTRIALTPFVKDGVAIDTLIARARGVQAHSSCPACLDRPPFLRTEAPPSIQFRHRSVMGTTACPSPPLRRQE